MLVTRGIGKLIHVYIAAPYTNGGKLINTFVAIDAANKLMELGYIPFVPHLTHWWDEYTSKLYYEWLEYDLHWLERCDALLRLEGYSEGADQEVAQAQEWGIPVFHSIADLQKAHIQLKFRL